MNWVYAFLVLILFSQGKGFLNPISDYQFFLISQKLRKQVSTLEAVICVLAAQIANFGESLIGAALQDKEGFGWVGFILILNLFMHFLKSQAIIVFIVNFSLIGLLPLNVQLNNDVVNVINISIGSILAILMKQLVLQN